MDWISVKDRLPEEGQIIVVWLSEIKEPSCVIVEKESDGRFSYVELALVDVFMDREDVVTHWLPLPTFPTI